MMAGPTTQASTAIGAVTDAQMARIFFKEYWLELAGARRSPAATVCLSCHSASRRRQVAHIARRARDRRVSYAHWVIRMSACRVMCGGIEWPYRVRMVKNGIDEAHR